MDESDRRSMRSLVLVLLGIAIIIIALMMVPKYTRTEESESKYRYNFFEFEQYGGVWYSTVQYGENLLQLALRNGPRQVESVSVTGSIAGFRDKYQSFYITFDPREENHDRYVTMANAEISPNLVVHFGKQVAPACAVEDPVCNESQVPIITCDNTDQAVIFLNRQPGPSVVIDGNCATISGIGLDMVVASDRFMYGMYGIMK
jgi:hypothetical protein